VDYLRSKRNKLNSLCFAWLICLVLIAAQWVGYSHRLQHLTTVVGSTVAVSSVIAANGQFKPASTPSYEALLHSCLLVDAASLSDAVNQVAYHFIPLKLSFPLVKAVSYVNWTALLQPVFSSRAPPFSLHY
jgi:hypothetical protein